MSGRRLGLLVAAVLTALVVAQYAGAVLTSRVYHFEDAADGYYPGHEATRRALKEGTLPLWEPGAWSGWPAVVDPYNGVYYPPNVLYYVLGGARGLGYSVALHALCAALGLYAFLRQRRLGVLAALVGALAYALSSFMVVRVRHVIFVQMAAWIPWILWAFDRWLEARRPRALLWLALFGALSLLAGGLSLEVLAGLPVLGYAAARLAGAWREAPAGARARRAGADLVWLGAASALGLALAAAQVVPSLAHLPESPRSLGTSYEFASSYAWPNLRYALTLLVPDLFGNNMRGRYAGVFNYWEMAGWYVGVGTWLCALLAVAWRPAGGPARRLELGVLAALALVAVGAALGDAGPVHKALYYGLPLYQTLRCPTRALYIVVLVVPILAAHGVDALGSAAGRRFGTRFGLALAGALLVVGAGVALAVTLPRADATPHAAALRLVLFAALGGAALVLAAARLLPARVAGVALAALVAADLLWQSAGYLKPEPPTFAAGTERFQAIEWVRAHSGGWRFVNDGSGPFRLHNVGMTYGLENASGYDSVPIWRYVNYLQVLNTGRPYPYPRLRHDLAAGNVTNFSSRLLDLLSVRYVVTYRPLPGPRFTRVFAPGTTTLAWAEAVWDRRLAVYENRDALPRAFVVYDARVVGGAAAAAAAIAARDFDPGATVVLEQAPAPAPVAPPAGAPARRAATVRAHERERVVLEAETDRPGVLVISEVYYPGWRALVDGRPAPLLRADYALRAVALGPGRHTVELRYESRPAIAGIFTSLAALALLGAATGFTARRRRPAAEADADTAHRRSGGS
jgi:hypothetical protein